MGEKMRRCVILGAAPLQNAQVAFRKITADDFVICADGGLLIAQKMGIIPDLLIGDFDSFQKKLPNNIETLTFSSDKDDTDMMCAVKEGIKRGFTEFILLGGIGGRLDHTVANFSILGYLTKKGCRGILLDEQHEISVLSAGAHTILGEIGQTISLFPFGSFSCTVSCEHLLYPLKGTTLFIDGREGPMGVSNRLLAEKVELFIHKGLVLAILVRE